MYSHQRSKVTCMWKIIFVECRPVGGQRGSIGGPNAIAAQRMARFFSNTCQKMRGGKHVKVKKRRRQDILHFCCADAQKLILGSIETPLDHLSVKIENSILSKLLSLKEHWTSTTSSSRTFSKKSWDFYTIRSVGMGNNCILSFTF